MFRRFALIVALMAFAGLMPNHSIAARTAASQAAIVADSLLPLFDTESAAQAHCPKDVVVWLNIPSGIYHYQGERWYGRTNTAPTPVRKRRSKPAIAPVRTANDAVRARSYARGFLFLSAFLYGLPSPIRAEETLAQTTAWLAQNLPNLAFADDGYGNVTHVVKYSFDGCNMLVKDRMSNVDSSSPANTRFYSITFTPLPGALLYGKPEASTKFQPQAATQSPNNFGLEEDLVIRLKNVDLSSLRIRAYRIDGSQPQTSAPTTMVFAPKEVDIGTTDSDLAEKGLRALRHAAKLCGATASGF